ncbi:hypothetical protein HMPREF1985_00740 [Mitsuokella sp. oral taxon 131 str. W9106]|nr:hypothetical protein HMPREF1985_00740 [Mitsuokella sp. oral taxon 131 str. W9106]
MHAFVKCLPARFEQSMGREERLLSIIMKIMSRIVSILQYARENENTIAPNAPKKGQEIGRRAELHGVPVLAMRCIVSC